MSEDMMIAGHMLKILALASIFFALSCIGVGYVIHDKWQGRKKVKAEEKLQDEWMEENAARFNTDWNKEELPY